GNAAGVLVGRVQVDIAVAVGFDEHNVGSRRNDMRPLDVERFFDLPTIRRIGRRKAGSAAGLRNDLEAGWIWQPKCLIEGVQIERGGWIIISIDNGDRL